MVLSANSLGKDLLRHPLKFLSSGREAIKHPETKEALLEGLVVDAILDRSSRPVPGFGRAALFLCRGAIHEGDPSSGRFRLYR